MEKMVSSIYDVIKKSNLDFSEEEITKAVEKLGVEESKKMSLTGCIKHINVLRELTFNKMIEENKINECAKRFKFWGVGAGSSMIYEAKQNGVPAVNNVIVTDDEIIIYGYNIDFNVMEKHRHNLSEIVKISNYRLGVVQTLRDTLLSVEFSDGEKVILTIGKDYRDEQNVKFLKLMNSLKPEIIDRNIFNIWNIAFGF